MIVETEDIEVIEAIVDIEETEEVIEDIVMIMDVAEVVVDTDMRAKTDDFHPLADLHLLTAGDLLRKLVDLMSIFLLVLGQGVITGVRPLLHTGGPRLARDHVPNLS